MEQERKAEELIKAGSEIAGSVASAVAGLLTAGPLAAVIGGALGPVATRALIGVCAEIHDRFVSPREKIRMGASAAYAISLIRERLQNGEQLRSDGFFDSKAKRSSAEEIFEGCLSKSKESYEERKAQFYGELFASIAFDQSVSRSQANQILAMADSFTYRQLCLLAIFNTTISDELRQGLRDENYALVSYSWETLTILHEIYSLYREGLVFLKLPSVATAHAMLDFLAVVPKYMQPQPSGQRLYRLMRLDKISIEDLEEVASHLT